MLAQRTILRGAPRAPRLSTARLGDETAHGDIASYRRTQQRYGGIPATMDGGISSAGFALPTHADAFDITGTVQAGGSYESSTTGGSDQLVTRKGTLPPDTNSQSSGLAIG